MPKNNRNAEVYFPLKIIALVLANDFQMVYVKQSVAKGRFQGMLSCWVRWGNPQQPHPTAGMLHMFVGNSIDEDVSPSGLCPLTI